MSATAPLRGDTRRPVPDSWDTMHPDDVVTKGGKFFYMFKRGGRRCFLTKGGPIVQPSYMTRVTLRQLHQLDPAASAPLLRRVAGDDVDAARTR